MTTTLSAGRPGLRMLAFTFCVLLLGTGAANQEAEAQPNYEIAELTNAPFVSRHNDVYFLDHLRGWIVNGAGEIHNTSDGGESWARQHLNSDAHFRSIGFVSETRGFAGNVGAGEFGATDTSPLFETTNGGTTWTAVTSISGDVPTGLCGMQVVNDSTVVAVGRVRGPASFVRTIDGGDTWSSVDMSQYAAGLIDVYFTHPDTGFVAGLTNAEQTLSSGVVLKTTDGGLSWEKKHETTRTGQWVWKLSFPSRRVGYASLQRNSGGPIDILKTVDGGETWFAIQFSEAYYFVQGIGFVDENRGWIGGNSSSPVFSTEDGGATWQSEEIRPRLNRFRFLGDSLGFAVGRSVYRIRRSIDTSVGSIEDQGFRLSPAYPNPSQSSVTIHYELPTPGPVELSVYDVSGRRVETLVAEPKPAGKYKIIWDGTTQEGVRAASGLYYFTLVVADFSNAELRLTQSGVLVK